VGDDSNFSGTKIALLNRGAVVAYLRDDKPGIPFRGLWDLPGGGREGDEDPVTCALREVEEEFGLSLSPSRVTHLTRRASTAAAGLANYFCAAALTDDEVAHIRFGEEGQRWAMMTVEEFIDHACAVPELKSQLSAYLAATSRASA
jgi:8-oxo-dGTP diphosphatase